MDNGIWGKGYNIVTKRITGNPPTPPPTAEIAKKLTDKLFPHHEEVNFKEKRTEAFRQFTDDELLLAAAKLGPGKAPGPEKIPTDILK